MQFLSGFPEKDLKIDEFTEKQKPRKSGIEIALEDEKKGRVTSYKNSDDLFEKVLN